MNRASTSAGRHAIEEILTRAIELHKADKLTDALPLYQQVLARDPRNARALHLLGVLKRQQNDHPAAVELISRSVALSPNARVYHVNLAEAYLAMGEFDCAAASCRAALQLSPDYPEALCGLGLALQGMGQRDEAVAQFRHALKLNPRLASAHAHLGLIQMREGQHSDALCCLKRAVQLEPGNATFHELLAELHTEREEFAESIPCWERALALAVSDRPGPHLSLGWAYQTEGRPGAAEAQFHRALALDSRSAAAHFKLGGLHEEAGDLQAAETAFRRALELEPGYTLARVRLATLLRGTLSDTDYGQLEKCLSDPDLAPGARARVLFSLAYVLDARAEFDRAAECATEANRLTREVAQGRRHYSAEEHQQFVTNLINAFDSDTMTRTKGLGQETRQPVFVFGLPRSGTTLIEQVLASHSRIYGAGELRLARSSYERIPAVVGQVGTPMECLQHLDSPSILRLAEEHLGHLRKLAGPSPERIVDKMPDNTMYLGLMAMLFPRAVFIHCRRDLRDVAVSCWMTDFRGLDWANDAEQIACRFREYRRLMDHWQSVLPVPVHHVDYEETVADLEPVARRLVAACGVDWEPGCLEFHRTQRPVRTASVAQVRQPLYQQSVGRWKHYESTLADLFDRLTCALEPDGLRSRAK
jgi:tetratricopeptide (TPR) repeat protein